MFNGRKTYITCTVAIIYAISGFLYGSLDANTVFQIILTALGAAGLRHGIAKNGSER